MRQALMPSTQVCVTFSVQITTDREADWRTLLYLLLMLVLFVRLMKQKAYQLMGECELLVMDITDLLIFIGKVIAITFTAFAYGLGVKP